MLYLLTYISEGFNLFSLFFGTYLTSILLTFSFCFFVGLVLGYFNLLIIKR